MITFLTGAGCSTASGIPDFASREHWEESIPREELFSKSFFEKNPQKFLEIYRRNFNFDYVEPNLFHYQVAELEQLVNVTVITQNVDGLHQKAGSSNVIELHGNALRSRCRRKQCQRVFPYVDKERCPVCRKFLAPDIVLFGEQVRHLRKAEEAIRKADLLIVAGTRLQVEPAASLVALSQKKIFVGKGNPDGFNEVFEENIGKTDIWVKRLKSSYLMKENISLPN